MTIQNQTKKVIINGNDSATVHSFSPMVVNSAAEVVVIHIDSAGVETTLSQGSSATTYSVGITSFPSTGSITYPAVGGTPLATGAQLVIKRVLTLEQQTDLENQGGYFAETQETQFDKFIMIDLQQQEEIDRAFRASAGETTLLTVELPNTLSATGGDAILLASDKASLEFGALSATLPDPVTIARGGTGATTAAAALTALGVTAAAQTVLDDTTVAAMRTTLGAQADLDVPSQAEAEAGTATTERVWTAQRVRQAATLPLNYIAGLTLSNDTDADHDIAIAVGECRDATDAADMALTAVLTKQIDATWALGDNAGGLDTGAVAADTVYGMWLIRRSDTGVNDALFSTSFTSPTMPTNYDQKRLIGFVTTNSLSNIIAFTQVGDYFRFTGDIIQEVTDSTITADTYETAALSLPPSCLAHLYARLSNNTATGADGMSIRTPSSAEENPSTASEAWIYLQTGAAFDEQVTTGMVLTNSSSQIEYAGAEVSGAATIHIRSIGCVMLQRSNPT